ncbi:BQ2448_7652 [Microbotryum intermedium]|uniref:BQ2448_7652 protein n=1 Tax=Microbotryum intermedium TaxID=269621 RepID=A0A238FRN1_9BASI|nr:BQ2448_7652 [Microbotryum intermedium]
MSDRKESSSSNTGGSGGGVTGMMKDAANTMNEKVKQMGSTASKEEHKSEMKDDSKSMGDRASAGVTAAQDKMNEMSHSSKA